MAITSVKIVKTSFFVDVLDVLINVALAIVSGSAVMLAEALQGGADLLTSALLWIGVSRSRRRADRGHRFGYGREVYFWSLISTILMVFVAATVTLQKAWYHLVNPQELSYTAVNMLVLLVALATNAYAFSLSYRRLKQATHEDSIAQAFLDSTLVEIKTTFVLDLMGSASALFGFVALGLYLVTGDSRFDGLGALMIGGSIVALGVLLIFDIKDLLIGRGVEEDVEQEIKIAAEGVEGVVRVRRVRTMYVGPESLFVALDVIFGRLKTPAKIEAIIDDIKQEIQAKVPTAHHIQIELET